MSEVFYVYLNLSVVIVVHSSYLWLFTVVFTMVLGTVIRIFTIRGH